MKLHDNIASEFDEFSKNYTNDMRALVPYYDFLMNLFSKPFENTFDPTHILDLGCGNGNVTAELLKIAPNAQYTLLDASQEMLSNCKTRFTTTKINFVKSYFNNYDFPKNHFDLVAGGFSLHHCSTSEKKEIFKRIYDTLTPNGVFACSDLMIDRSTTAHKILLEKWKAFVHQTFPDDEKWTWLMEHYNTFDKPDDLHQQLNWLKEIGFKDFEISVKDHFWVHFKTKK